MKKVISSLLILVMAISGCSMTQPKDDIAVSESIVTTADVTSVTTAETLAPTSTPTPTPEPEPYGFNPHVHSSLLSEVVKEEWWDSFYNMCDAMREGKDTFECSDKAAYKWCTDEVTLGDFFPAACTLVKGDGYKDGTGRLKYKIDKESFAARQSTFEEEIVRMVNEAVRSDYTDFEKLMAMYDYVTLNFSYDFSDIDGSNIDEFGNYACLTSKNGICCEIADSLAYLLMQCGVDAVSVSGYGDNMDHEWTYVVIDGKGYHVDATWALRSGDPSAPLFLTYFMQTDDERVSDGFDRDRFEVHDLSWWKKDYDKSRFAATDEKFKPLHDNAEFVSMDREKKVIKYRDIDWNVLEFPYE
ncbi:MAG: transglutaminase family protein [Clostridiales bacterium]|nr:transglutaminase family protein [Clostridiales bacterium]